MNSHHQRQRSLDGKMKIYRKPAATIDNNMAGNCGHFSTTAAAVGLDNPRKRNDRNTNVYASFPPATTNKNLLPPSKAINDTCSFETSPSSSSSQNYNKSSLSTGVLSSATSTPSTTPQGSRRAHRERTIKSNSSNSLEALSIDALYAKIRGTVNQQPGSTTTTASSHCTTESGRSRARRKNVPANFSSTTVTGSGTTKSVPPATTDDGVDDVYFDLSALNFNFKHPTATPVMGRQAKLNATADAGPWQPVPLPSMNTGSAANRLPNLFFSFDHDADVYSLHSLPLRSPTTQPRTAIATARCCQQQQQNLNVSSSLRQRRRLPELPTETNNSGCSTVTGGRTEKSRNSHRRSADKSIVSYRRQHLPVTATLSSGSTQPLLSPSMAAVKPVIVKSPSSKDGGGSITCSRCHKCRCCACREPLARIERAGRFARYCMEFGTCMWCARQCVSDDDDNDGELDKVQRKRHVSAARRRSASSTGFFSGRRLKLAVMSLVCPCLCLYKPLKSGGNVCDSMCKRVLAHRACLCESDKALCEQAGVAADAADRSCTTLLAPGVTETKQSMLFCDYGDNKNKHNGGRGDFLTVKSATATSEESSPSSSVGSPYDFLSSFLSTPTTTNTSSSNSTNIVFG